MVTKLKNKYPYKLSCPILFRPLCVSKLAHFKLNATMKIARLHQNRNGTRAFLSVGKSSIFFSYHNLVDWLLAPSIMKVLSAVTQAVDVWPINARPRKPMHSKR